MVMIFYASEFLIYVAEMKIRFFTFFFFFKPNLFFSCINFPNHLNIRVLRPSGSFQPKSQFITLSHSQCQNCA